MNQDIWGIFRRPRDASKQEVEPYIQATPAPKGVPFLAGLVAIVLVAGVVGAIVQAGRARPESPVALVHAAPDATTRSGTAHFATTVAIRISGEDGPSVTMSGDEDFANHDAQITLASEGVSSTVRLVAGVEYFQSALIPLPAGAKWVKILPQDLGAGATQPGLAGSGDPSQGLQFLGSTVGSPVTVGHATVGGTSTTHYSVTFDLADLFARVGQAGNALSPGFAKGFDSLKGKVDLAHIPGNVWLDSAGRVRQFSYTIAFQTAGQAFSEVETTTFSAFGNPVHVTAPSAGETVPFSAVKNEFAQLLSPPGAVA